MDRKIFDFEAALYSMQGKNHILEMVVYRFLEAVYEVEMEIREHFEKGRIDPIGLLGHRLKGSCATVCAPELTGIFQEMEEASRQGDRESIARVIERIEPALDRFRRAWERTRQVDVQPDS